MDQPKADATPLAPGPDAEKPAAPGADAEKPAAPEADAEKPAGKKGGRKFKKAPRGGGEGAPSEPRAPRKAPGEARVSRKRGPPRPHRKLTPEVLQGRIEKLTKRIDKARGLLEEAERHIVGYHREAKYRADESGQAPAAEGPRNSDESTQMV